MHKPTVTLLSRDAALIANLTARLAKRYTLCVRNSLDEQPNRTVSAEPRGLIADFRSVSGGGHAEDRFLDDACRQLPEQAIVLLTSEECPEILERRIACSKIVHCRGDVDPDRVACSLSAHLTESDSAAEDHSPSETVSAETTSVEPGPNVGRDTAPQGTTRQFETDSPRMQSMLTELDVAAKHDVTILLIGETGSGKTYLSKLIHDVSPRRDEPFLTVACGALPGDLIESELFGHVKGAFTSAHADKEGKFLAAGAGTVLLDEIDVLTPEQQVKLLRVIETGEFEPVGSNKTLKSRARLVVASNLELEPLVKAGRFRPDLYYRLNMLKFDVLPLRDRTADIIPLTRHFIALHAERHGIEIRSTESNLFEALLAYPWPGNVRELENVLQRAVIYCSDGLLNATHLPPHIRNGVTGPTNDPSIDLMARPSREEPRGKTLGRRIELTEQEIIEQALFLNNFSRTNTAKSLGISRVTLYNKMKKYGMPNKYAR